MPSRDRIRSRSRVHGLWRKDLPWHQLPLWVPLTGAAAIYRVGLAARTGFWRRFARQSGIVTVAVGNLTVGGNGKTPFTLFLARKLRERGLRVGIVSRGYLGTRRGERALLISNAGEPSACAQEAGDEPLMMARSFAGPIAVAARRIDGIRLLQRTAPLDVVLLDDAFQHLRLRRDVNLLLVNAARGLGNGWLLPAGPMREPLGAARRADAVVFVGSGARAADGLTSRQRRKLERGVTFNARFEARALVHSERGQWQETPPVLGGRRVLAVSGLADPSGFYTMLRELEADLVGVLEFPDHHPYSFTDWQAISAAAREADVIVTSEKDLVKLERFPFARDSLYALRLEVVMGPDEARLLEMIDGAVQPSRPAAEA